MDTAIVSVVEDDNVVNQVVEALRKEGIKDKNVRIMDDGAETLLKELGSQGFDKADAQGFADAVEQGLKLVSVRVSQEMADQAASILERFEMSPEDIANAASRTDRLERSVPIVEERLAVGKAKSPTGGVRVTSKVTERPVEETVALREEHVTAVERAADRPLDPEEAEAAFEEKTVEMMGIKEEAEISKEASVVGEVLITKDTTEHVEEIRDTVRKTDVDVEEINTTPKKRK